MKARIQQEPRCVLLWQVAPGSAEHAAVEHAARLSRLKVRLLTAADLGTTMEALCTGRHTGGEAAPAPDVPERPAMIVSGLRHDNGDLGQFVDEVRRGGDPAARHGNPHQPRLDPCCPAGRTEPRA